MYIAADNYNLVSCIYNMEPQWMLSTALVKLIQWRVWGVNRVDAAAQPYVSDTLLSLIMSRRSSDPFIFIIFPRCFPD